MASEVKEQVPNMEQTVPNVEPKKKRTRLKGICSQIRNQMEFYFSDANLTKDRFLRKEIDKTEDGYLPLDMFLQFNRIKSLTSEASLVAKALSTSDMITVSSDGLKVKRTHPIADVKDVDDRTIYVECLPPGVDHDWLKRVFGAYGKVVYVSLPRYQTSGDLKGFAFIEFSKRKEAHKACEMMNNPPEDAPDKAGHFPKSSKQIKQIHKQLAQKGESDADAAKAGAKKLKRRRRNTSESSGEGGEERPSGGKQARLDSESDEVKGHSDKENRKRSSSSVSDADTEEQQAAESGNRKRKADHDAKETEQERETKEEKQTEVAHESSRKQKTDNGTKDTEQDTKDEQSCESSAKRLKSSEETEVKEPLESSFKRKRKSETGEDIPPKKVRINETVKVEEVVTGGKRRKKNKKASKDKDMPQLRVLPKQEWLQLRHEYLALQKASMSHLKGVLRRNKPDANKDKSKDKTGKGLEFQSDVIVKVVSEQPKNLKEVQEAAKEIADVSYVDFKDGESEGYIRCPNPENAAKMTAGTSHKDLTFTLLQGDEENSYWEKITKDRETKMKTKTKRKKRGSQKIIDRAEKSASDLTQRKHVIFDD